MHVGGLATDVAVAGRWGFVGGHAATNVLNEPETGHGLPTVVNGVAIRNNGQPLGYLPVMTDATKATTFDDLGSTIQVFDTATNRFVFRYVDVTRDLSVSVVPGQVVDLGDHTAAQKIIRGSGPEQLFVRGDFLFVTQLHSDKVGVFRINQTPATPADILRPAGIEFAGGITPMGVAVSPDGRTVFVANMQTEDVSFLRVDANGGLTRQGFVTVGVTGVFFSTSATPNPLAKITSSPRTIASAAPGTCRSIRLRSISAARRSSRSASVGVVFCGVTDCATAAAGGRRRTAENSNST